MTNPRTPIYVGTYCSPTGARHLNRLGDVGITDQGGWGLDSSADLSRGDSGVP